MNQINQKNAHAQLSKKNCILGVENMFFIPSRPF